MAKLKFSYPVFRHAPSVTCGTGALRGIAAGGGLEDTVFLTSAAAPVTDTLAGVLERAGAVLGPDNHLAKPPGEPSADAVRAAGRFIDERAPARIVAVGGGSVLDWARLGWGCAAGLLDVEAGRWTGDDAPVVRPRFWLVPTTCGTGAEAADVAVYQLDDGDKAAVVASAFMADRVILDGRFVEQLAPAARAAFLCDALSHAVEGYLSLVPMRLAKESALDALNLALEFHDAEPTPSRGERLMEASFLGGVAAANCSVGIVHAFAHAIGRDGMPHGLANACGLLDGLRFNADTPAMAALLSRRGLASVDALIEALRPVVDTALTALGPDAPVRELADAGYRTAVAERMQRDVAIRTNPRRPADTAELTGWLERVHATAAAA